MEGKGKQIRLKYDKIHSWQRLGCKGPRSLDIGKNETIHNKKKTLMQKFLTKGKISMSDYRMWFNWV